MATRKDELVISVREISDAFDNESSGADRLRAANLDRLIGVRRSLARVWERERMRRAAMDDEESRSRVRMLDARLEQESELLEQARSQASIAARGAPRASKEGWTLYGFVFDAHG